jgi:hypothetical protein
MNWPEFKFPPINLWSLPYMQKFTINMTSLPEDDVFDEVDEIEEIDENTLQDLHDLGLDLEGEEDVS